MQGDAVQGDTEPGVTTLVERALVARFGQRPDHASMAFVGVDPVEVLRFRPDPDERVLVSLGMSSLPMTGAAEVIQDADGPRAELLLRLRDPLDRFGGVWRSVALLAAAPVVEGVVYTAGMTVDTAEPLTAGTLCTGAILVESGLAVVTTARGPVEVLELVPATPTELAWARVQGSDALRERWRAQHVDLLDLARDPVGLR